MSPEVVTLGTDTAATAEPAARTIRGRIALFGVPSSSQRVTLTPGALQPREPLHRVKLLIDHDLAKPVGVLAQLDINEREAWATFDVPEGAAGDEALASAKAGLRDGLSVGFSVRAGTPARDGKGYTITAAELHEVSLVAVPDFSDAAVTTVTASATPKGNTMPDTIAEPTTAPAPPETSTPPAPAEAPADVRLAAAPETPTPQTAPVHAEVTPRGFDLGAAVQHMAGAINSGDPDAIRLALADIVPAQDTANAFLGGNGGWLGELFTASVVNRHWIDAYGPVQQLTEIKGTGWRWTKKPAPAKYSGNKTDVPSDTVGTEAASFTAERWAGGWDIDRIFLDLGDPSFLASFWEAAMAEYKTASNADIAAKTIAAATASTASPTTALDALRTLARELRSIGASASTVFLGESLYDAFTDLKQSEVPFWLANAVGGVDITQGTADQGPGLRVQSAPELPANMALALDKRAAVIREKTPLRIQGVDIARGGVDLGFFSYGRFDLHDARAIRKVTVTAAPPAGGGE